MSDKSRDRRPPPAARGAAGDDAKEDAPAETTHPPAAELAFPYIMELAHPVTVGDREVRELRFRQATARDLRPLPANAKVGDLLDLAARVTNETDTAINKLLPDDYRRVLEIVQSFL